MVGFVPWRQEAENNFYNPLVIKGLNSGRVDLKHRPLGPEPVPLVVTHYTPIGYNYKFLSFLMLSMMDNYG